MLLPEGVSPCALPLTALVSPMRFRYVCSAADRTSGVVPHAAPSRVTVCNVAHSARRGSFAPDSRSLPSLFGACGGKLSALVATFVAEFRVWQTAAAAVGTSITMQALPH